MSYESLFAENERALAERRDYYDYVRRMTMYGDPLSFETWRAQRPGNSTVQRLADNERARVDRREYQEYCRRVFPYGALLSFCAWKAQRPGNSPVQRPGNSPVQRIASLEAKVRKLEEEKIHASAPANTVINVSISGALGIGKSRLARKLEDVLYAAGFSVYVLDGKDLYGSEQKTPAQTVNITVVNN